MELSKLEIDLHPRPNAQALDLGFTLLRTHAKDTYAAWLALMLPCIAVCALLAWLFPRFDWLWLLLPWWVKPLFERAPLYVLSRGVFGEHVSWKEAIRAWPGQLGGGWFRMLTWWRLFMPGRGLYQPIWQLEGARGEVAAERRKVIGKSDTGRAAYWFGTACAHFQGVLQLGLLAFIGVFLSKESTINPFAFLFAAKNDRLAEIVLTFGGYAFSEAIIGPIYIACCFMLYLNRRATLEAWDIEIVLRQIKPPTTKKPIAHAMLAALVCVTLVLAFQPSPSSAADHPMPSAVSEKCEYPEGMASRVSEHPVDHDPEQSKLHEEIAQLFANEDLSGYQCEKRWMPKKRQKEKTTDWSLLKDIELVVQLLKIAFIICAVFLVVWLLYRYRDKLGFLYTRRETARATEVSGFDIRPESLPEDVAAEVRRLWQVGNRREALALLYRATLSRLANQENVPLGKAATEGDCLRSAEDSRRRQHLSADKFSIVADVIELWQQGAYADRWPEGNAVIARCAAWDAAFGRAALSATGEKP